MKHVWLFAVVLFQSSLTFAATEIDFSDKFQSTSRLKDGYEEIGAINGVEYHIKFNGTGIFAGGKDSEIQGASYNYRHNWRVLCFKDAITDNKKCTLLKPDIAITAFQDGKFLLHIGAKHFPGTKVYLRIDDEPASSASNPGFDFETSATLVDKIKVAKKITTRFTEWPNEYPVDNSSTTFGFNEALQYMLWAVKRIK